MGLGATALMGPERLDGVVARKESRRQRSVLEMQGIHWVPLPTGPAEEEFGGPGEHFFQVSPSLERTIPMRGWMTRIPAY